MSKKKCPSRHTFFPGLHKCVQVQLVKSAYLLLLLLQGCIPFLSLSRSCPGSCSCSGCGETSLPQWPLVYRRTRSLWVLPDVLRYIVPPIEKIAVCSCPPSLLLQHLPRTCSPVSEQYERGKWKSRFKGNWIPGRAQRARFVTSVRKSCPRIAELQHRHSQVHFSAALKLPTIQSSPPALTPSLCSGQ